MAVPVLDHEGAGGEPQVEPHVPEQPLRKVAAPYVGDAAVDGDGEEEGPEPGFKVQGGLGIVRSEHTGRDDQRLGLDGPLEVERDGHDEAVDGVHVRLDVCQGLEHGYCPGVRCPGNEGGIVALRTLHVVQGQPPRPGGRARGAERGVRVVRGEGVAVRVEGGDRGLAHRRQDGVDGGGVGRRCSRNPELEQVVVVKVPYDLGAVSYGVEVTHVLTTEMVPRQGVDEGQPQGVLCLRVQVHHLRVALAAGPPGVVVSRTLLVANDHHAPPDQLGLPVYGLGGVEDGGHHRPPLASTLLRLFVPRGRKREVLEAQLGGGKLSHDFIREGFPARCTL